MTGNNRPLKTTRHKKNISMPDMTGITALHTVGRKNDHEKSNEHEHNGKQGKRQQSELFRTFGKIRKRDKRHDNNRIQ